MIYECDQCSAALPASALVCPKCGEKFDAAVPADAEIPRPGFSAAAPAPPSISPLTVTAPAPTNRRSGSYDWLEPPPTTPQRPAANGSPALRVLGALFLLGGLALTVYFFAVFDTSLALPSGSASVLGIDRVNNLGLMADKQNGIIIGMGCAILGAILMYAGRKHTHLA